MSIKNALASGGWLVASVALVLGALGGEQVQPVENLIPSAPAVSRCPDGWKDTSEEAEHTPVFKCQREAWTVYIFPDGMFQYGLMDPKVNPTRGFEMDSAKVPGWPR